MSGEGVAAAADRLRLRELIEEFEQSPAPGGFHHVDHVRMAFAYVTCYPILEAVAKFTAALKRFAAAQGKPRLYHETITWAYLLLIHERVGRGGREQTWEEFARDHSDLLVWKGGILSTLYCQETLDSELARGIFVLPDRGANARSQVTP
jgi:hypothetical protein